MSLSDSGGAPAVLQAGRDSRHLASIIHGDQLMEIGLALPQYDFFAPEPEPGRLAWARGRGHRPPGRRARLPLPLAVRPPLPRPQPVRRPHRPLPRLRPPARPRPPWPGSPTGPGSAPSPSAPPSARPPSPPSSWPPSTCSPADGSPSAWARVVGGRVPGGRRPLPAARASGCATWRSRSTCCGGCSAAAPSPSTAATSRRSGAMCLPRPVQQPAPPIWVGGKGDRLLDLVARVGRRVEHGVDLDPRRLPASASRCSTPPASGPAATRPRSPGPSASSPWWARTRPTWSAGSSACGRPRPRWPGRRSARRVATGPAGGDGRRGRGTSCDGWAALGVSTVVVSPRPLPFSVPGRRRPRSSGPGL